MVEPPPLPARITINQMMVERVALYCHAPPPGRTIPVEVNPLPVDDSIPEGAEVAEAVKRLRLNRPGGPSCMQLEHLHQWLWEATLTKETDTINWRKVVALEQAEFQEGSLAEACTWQTVVLIPKGDGKDFRGIGLVEFVWKATTGIINWRLNSEICYHDNLHGFRTGRGTGTTILEAKMLQQPTSMKEEFLNTIFMDLQKVYDTLVRYRCIDILTGYSVGPRTLHILWTYWYWLQMVAKTGGYFNPPLQWLPGGDPG